MKDPGRTILMAFLAFAVFAATAKATLGGTVAKQSVLDNLDAVSVTISVDGRGCGSGTLFTRKSPDPGPGITKSYVMTAAHVVDALRLERTVIEDGKKRIVISFKDCQVYKETIQRGRNVERRYLDCKVICFNAGEDLAILEVRLDNYTDATARLYKGEKIHGVGTELLHVGSLLGDLGPCSLGPGVTSRVGRLLPTGPGGQDRVFDQTTVTAFPGSSGGGIFDRETGDYVGMLTMRVDRGQGFAWYIPVRRIAAWVTDMNLMWTLDPKLPVPDGQPKGR